MKKALKLLSFITAFAATTSLHPQLGSILGYSKPETGTARSIDIAIHNLTDQAFDLDLCYTSKNSPVFITDSSNCDVKNGKLKPNSVTYVEKPVRKAIEGVDLNYRLSLYRPGYLANVTSRRKYPLLSHDFVPSDFSVQATLASDSVSLEFMIIEPVKGVFALIKVSDVGYVELPTIEQIG